MAENLRGRVADRRQQTNGNGNGNGEVVKAEPTLAQTIAQMQGEFQKAMPRGAEAVQLIRDAQTAVRTTPKLAQCTQASILGGLMTLAQLGLRVGVLGHAWLLPLWNSREKRFEAQLIIGYQGMVELAHRSGRIESLIARTVYEHDQFEVDYGLSDNLVHKPVLRGDRGAAIAYYAVAKFQGGGHAFFVMSQDEMEDHRDRFAMAKKKDGTVVGPWRDNFESMALKGLALDTPIPTPFGWTTMAVIRRGDTVFDLAGDPVAVTATSEVKLLDCYRVTFANGESVVCDAEHYWLARVGSNGVRSGWHARPISDLYRAKQRGERVTMPVTPTLNTQDAILPVDPWVLGFWLGDGSTGSSVVHCSVRDQPEVTAAIAAAGYEIGAVRRDARNNAVSVGIRGGLWKALSEGGLLGMKFVPQKYFRASPRQRLALLRGLMDSDGYIDNSRNRAHFTNTNKDLADAVAQLARSLGEVVHADSRWVTGYGVRALRHTVHWQPSVVPVSLLRKVERVRERQVAPYRSVKSIDKVASVPTRCISVDSPTRTYLAGVGMIPTHNTVVRQLSKWLPKATDFASAIAADETVRVDTSPDTDAMLHGKQVIEGVYSLSEEDSEEDGGTGPTDEELAAMNEEANAASAGAGPPQP